MMRGAAQRARTSFAQSPAFLFVGADFRPERLRFPQRVHAFPQQGEFRVFLLYGEGQRLCVAGEAFGAGKGVRRASRRRRGPCPAPRAGRKARRVRPGTRTRPCRSEARQRRCAPPSACPEASESALLSASSERRRPASAVSCSSRSSESSFSARRSASRAFSSSSSRQRRVSSAPTASESPASAAEASFSRKTLARAASASFLLRSASLCSLRRSSSALRRASSSRFRLFRSRRRASISVSAARTRFQRSRAFSTASFSAVSAVFAAASAEDACSSCSARRGRLFLQRGELFFVAALLLAPDAQSFERRKNPGRPFGALQLFALRRKGLPVEQKRFPLGVQGLFLLVERRGLLKARHVVIERLLAVRQRFRTSREAFPVRVQAPLPRLRAEAAARPVCF